MLMCKQQVQPKVHFAHALLLKIFAVLQHIHLTLARMLPSNPILENLRISVFVFLSPMSFLPPSVSLLLLLSLPLTFSLGQNTISTLSLCICWSNHVSRMYIHLFFMFYSIRPQTLSRTYSHPGILKSHCSGKLLYLPTPPNLVLIHHLTLLPASLSVAHLSLANSSS